MIPSIVIAVMAVFGVGVASSQALPGEMLYPVKVNVTEKLEQSIHFSREGKAVALANQLDARIKEATKLSSSTPEATAELDAAYTADVKEIAAYIETLQAKGDYKTAADLSLRTRGKLNKGNTSIDGKVFADLSAKMRSDEDVFGKVSILLQGKVDADAEEDSDDSSGSSASSSSSASARLKAEDEDENDEKARTDVKIQGSGDVRSEGRAETSTKIDIDI